MPLLLLTLLAIAIAITIVGFLLSAKAQVRDPQAAYYSDRIGRRRVATASERSLRTTSGIPLRTSATLSTSMIAMGAGQAERAGYTGYIPGQRGGKPVPWTVITIGLISIFILFFYFLGMVLPQRVLLGYFSLGSAPAASPTTSSSPVLYGASQKLVRIGQLNRDQYNTKEEYNTWAYSACSAAAMAEVINAYGHNYRVIDILKIEIQLQEITPELGLLEDVGIARAGERFGFNTSWGRKLSFDQVIAAANRGTPVIVSFPPDRYAGGHIVVVTGGSGNSVYLADSSIYNRRSITRQQFLQWWEGFSAIMTPK